MNITGSMNSIHGGRSVNGTGTFVFKTNGNWGLTGDGGFGVSDSNITFDASKAWTGETIYK